MVNIDIARLRQLVDDLLEISRLEAQAAETVIEPVDVRPFLGQLVQAHGWSETVRVRPRHRRSATRPGRSTPTGGGWNASSSTWSRTLSSTERRR